MSDNIKICPQCNAEYFAHAERCSSCEVDLVSPGEAPEAHHDHDHSVDESDVPWPDGPSEVLMEATLAILQDMGNVLNKNGLPYEIYEKPHIEGVEDKKNAASCRAGESEYAIVVPKAKMEESIKITEAHWYKQHPEQVESDKRASLGQCPACAAQLEDNPGECPDCGLNLSVFSAPEHDDCC
jgi:hypothetical protein